MVEINSLPRPIKPLQQLEGKLNYLLKQDRYYLDRHVLIDDQLKILTFEVNKKRKIT